MITKMNYYLATLLKYVLVLLFIPLICNYNAYSQSITKYVNPFIGTAGHGHTYPGATTPFGMVQPSPDNGTAGWDWCSGYHYTDDTITGFGQLHLSGTGIGDLSDILITPTNKQVNLSLFGTTKKELPYTSKFSHNNEKASPGYYSVFLDNSNTKVELTANQYIAYHKYTYNNPKTPSFILDLGYAVNWDKVLKSNVKVVGQKSIEGYRYSTGWAKNQKVFFRIETSEPIVNSDLVKDNVKVSDKEVKGEKTGGQFYFATNTKNVEIKVSISSVSILNARKNMIKYGENTFDKVRISSQKLWDKALSKIEVESPVDSLKTIFYTSMYHAQVSPTIFSDVNGEFRLQNDEVKKQKNITYSTLSLWDIFRTQVPLLTIIDPDRVNDIVSSMLSYYDESGTLPVWVLSGNETNTMPRYHSVSIIAEAYKKGISNNNATKAFEAIKKTMMGNDRGLQEYKKYGYIPYDKMDQSVSISLNLSYNDWCAGQMALITDNKEDYKYFNKRAKSYQHFFDKKSGFLRGKSSDGSTFHSPFNPKKANHLKDNDYTEGNAWQHSWYVLHDIEGLIQLHGGNDKFASMVEQLFKESSDLKGNNVSPDISGLIGQYAHGNEPSHHIAYTFNKANKPWKTQYWVREILKSQYSTKPDGLSGNEDCGQMSAWYIMSAIGLYPLNPASLEYEIGSPIFTSIKIQLQNGKLFTIKAPNTSDKNIYIQSVKLNDVTLNRTFITYKEIMNGGVLAFTMGEKPNYKWALKK